MAKVLIVEDDALLREVYSDTLRSAGHTIETAEDGESAYLKIKAGGWDMVLLDIILPKINGLDLIEKMANDPPASPNKCLIFLTNLDKAEEIEKALKLGNGYLIKSQITPGDLVSEVNRYLSKQMAQQVT